MGDPIPRPRVVDDTDPAVQYGPSGWFIADPKTLNVGNLGQIYQGTSHATTSNSTLSFPFNGTSIRVLGTMMVSTVNNVTDPTWNCFVDGTKIDNPDPDFASPQNNWSLCDGQAISSGSHVLTIQVQSKGQAFYLDHLVYTPPPEETFESAVLIYSNTDPSVVFGSGWSTSAGQNMTNQQGSQVTLNFVGTSVSLYGLVPASGFSHNSTWATYTIDGGSSVNFTLGGLPSRSTTTQRNIVSFTTSTIQSGSHTLVATYGGDNGHTPLVVGEFMVTTTSIDTDSSSSAPVLPSKKIPVAGIAGGVVGAIAVLALLAALVVCYRRQRRDVDPPPANPYQMSTTDTEALPSMRPATVRTLGKEASVAPTPSTLTDDRPHTVVVQHEDSGARMLPNVEEQVVELPPGYTAN
ncbi:hypothetical protein C8R47DRAFT_1047111 [Mycena vitilis]|nr:hypothetical protein C8R47DRAFT_1047111 [Mycena vitilis]